MKLKNETFDFLKWFALVGMPAMITFYGVLGATLHIPYTQEALTISVAFNTMLGTMLGISSKQYKEEREKDDE